MSRESYHEPLKALNEADTFKLFSQFWLEAGDFLLQSPFNGQLQKIYLWFYQFLTHHKPGLKHYGVDGIVSWEEFKGILDQFNEFTGGAIETSNNISTKISTQDDSLDHKNVSYINRAKIVLFQDKTWDCGSDVINHEKLNLVLTGAHETGNNDATSNPKETLLTMLGQSIHTQVTAEVNPSWGIPPLEFNNNYSDLEKLLKKPSALVILNKQRAKIGTVRKPFFDYCNDPSHAKILSKVCISRKEFLNFQGNNNGLNKRDNLFPSLEQCYKLIESNKKIFSKEIYECCHKNIHPIPIINSNTDISLGDCSYLDTCHKMKNCRYLHYFSLIPLIKAKRYNVNAETELKSIKQNLYKQEHTIGFSHMEFLREVLPPQWISCDVRYLPFLILGKFAVVLADPAWDIHMSLPYGTCTDEELMSLPIHELQDEGMMLLWVTGRSIEIGRKALKKWGYVISDELIWLKLNQLKRTIVTGRTGHWLNHSKEHLLVGLKGNPPWINRMTDINTIVSGTRETLRKPDEIYELSERITGCHSRKLEIFGRDHNVRPGWFTIGDQLTGTSIYEKDVLKRYDEFKIANSGKKPPTQTQTQRKPFTKHSKGGH